MPLKVIDAPTVSCVALVFSTRIWVRVEVDPEIVTPVRVPRAGSNLGRVSTAVKSVRLGPTVVQAAGVVSACEVGDHAPMPTASTTAEATASGRGRTLVRMGAPCGSPDPRSADPERRHPPGTPSTRPVTGLPCIFRLSAYPSTNSGLRISSARSGPLSWRWSAGRRAPRGGRTPPPGRPPRSTCTPPGGRSTTGRRAAPACSGCRTAHADHRPGW